ncbi:Acyltransferase-like protein, chloroplastic [Vitis vinifera]|uniref:Acyltransferase-like protein, chloroplastic n=1 Tax=Vitis vinifera TaxID=29760 RepID=A0A438JCZ6_VITVI|nr:Acyltransferase-like protein, chloroplastic [Vitis vinifera]
MIGLMVVVRLQTKICTCQEFYQNFGKPIETEGRKQELREKEKAHEPYLHVKSEVESCRAYLKEKRKGDPYRNILPRLLYQATHGFTSEIPTFEL